MSTFAVVLREFELHRPPLQLQCATKSHLNAAHHPKCPIPSQGLGWLRSWPATCRSRRLEAAAATTHPDLLPGTAPRRITTNLDSCGGRVDEGYRRLLRWHDIPSLFPAMAEAQRDKTRDTEGREQDASRLLS